MDDNDGLTSDNIDRDNIIAMDDETKLDPRDAVSVARLSSCELSLSLTLCFALDAILAGFMVAAVESSDAGERPPSLTEHLSFRPLWVTQRLRADR